MKTASLQTIKQVVLAHGLMELEAPLTEAGFETKYIYGDVPMPPVYVSAKKDGIEFIILNNKYADGADIIVGEGEAEIAIGVLE